MADTTVTPLKVAAILFLEQLPCESYWIGEGPAAVQGHGVHPAQIADRLRYVDKILTHVAPGQTCHALFAPLGSDVRAWCRAMAGMKLVELDHNPDEPGRDFTVLLTRKGFAWMRMMTGK